MREVEKATEMMIKYLGGRENISHYTHCMTMLRFRVIDPAQVDIKGIEGLAGVKGTLEMGERVHVVIGSEVVEYDEAIKKPLGR